MENDFDVQSAIAKQHAARAAAVAQGLNAGSRNVEASGSLGGSIMRPLDSLSLAADRIENMIARVDGFVQRFHGVGPCQTLSSNAPAAPTGYSGQLSRLSAAIDGLESSVRALGDIG